VSLGARTESPTQRKHVLIGEIIWQSEIQQKADGPTTTRRDVAEIETREIVAQAMKVKNP